MNYTITLHDFPALPDDARATAERRFRQALEKALGGPDAVPLAYRAWTNASESSDVELSKEEVTQASQWVKAMDLAKQAGFRELGESDEAYFEVKMER